VHAEHTAEIHRVLLDQLNAQAVQAEHAATQRFSPPTRCDATNSPNTPPTSTPPSQKPDSSSGAARTALLDIAGGPEGIITERDIIARRVTAQHADINVLNLARAHARELDSPLARVEAAAARAFATAQADRNDRMIDVGAVPAASVV
jgi:hypothetical protein